MNTWTIAGDADGQPTSKQCLHLSEALDVDPPDELVCVDCVVEGTSWVHLRQCLLCGGVRCCDQSPRHHATTHYKTSGHALMRSAQPDEAWGWCYPDELFLLPEGSG